MREYTSYQKKVISRYYENREQIDEQKLAELVTILYLAKSDKQREKLWVAAEEAMTRLELPAARVKHVCEKRDVALLAEFVQDLQKGSVKRGK